MSVGVNLLCKLAAEAARILKLDYDVEIIEMHHNQKKDAPSGTAVTLAETVAKELGLDYEKDTRHGRQGLVGARTKKEIGMHSLRGGDVVGDHTVIFAAEGERIELTHKASSRDTFVHGALRAAEFLQGVPNGLYDMRDVLGFK
jgi:4-hydroxy-tetrahydrodipicolinate reductase